MTSEFPPERRRATDTPVGDTARILAIAYTVGYFIMVATLLWKPMPAENKEIVFQLVGILSIIQSGITGYFFGYSKASEASQKLLAADKERTAAVILDIAKNAASSQPPDQK